MNDKAWPNLGTTEKPWQKRLVLYLSTMMAIHTSYLCLSTRFHQMHGPYGSISCTISSCPS